MFAGGRFGIGKVIKPFSVLTFLPYGQGPLSGLLQFLVICFFW
ncbi:15420_t:CDS:2 [Funneliformis caledonium]|uniref:15420_t:CDS:1 n=1 Tax=Funneliformis caledonium TaxID=1117310 RepID=A0A9N9GI48_9GLOM|nr:15420_t:CDS:2 [Funneliformis caledonium]